MELHVLSHNNHNNNNNIIIYNLFRGKAPVTGSDFQGGPLRVKIKYTKAKNIQYN